VHFQESHFAEGEPIVTPSPLEPMRVSRTRVTIPGIIESLHCGNLLVDQDVALPESVKFEGWVSIGKWILLSQIRSAELDRQLTSVGWYFFSFPPELRKGAVAMDRKHALARALQKLLANAEAAKVNTLEIIEVRRKEFPGLGYASLRGCMRHIQESPVVFQTAEEAHKRILRASHSQHVYR
jgi:hypothetical protein